MLRPKPPPSPRRAPCDLCGDNTFQVVSRRDRRGRPLTTVVCVRCGLLSHERLPSDRELRDYYAAQYRQDYHGQAVPAPHRVLRAWEGGRWVQRLLRPYLSTRQRVFEVGAGLGCMVKAFAASGFEATGIEPGGGFHWFAKHRLGARIERRSLDEVPAVPSYDLILLVHVIEHFNAPREALARLAQLLNPGGMLYVECPNAGAPHAALSKMFHYAHIYNFTPDTLEMMAAAGGFRTRVRLSAAADRSLRLLLVKDPLCSWQLNAGSYRRTLAALQRYNSWTYHLRPSYLRERIGRDCRFLSHHLLPRTRVRRLLSSPGSAAPPPAGPERRSVAAA